MAKNWKIKMQYGNDLTHVCFLIVHRMKHLLCGLENFEIDDKTRQDIRALKPLMPS